MPGRFAEITEKKARGATYTPRDLAAYLAARLVDAAAPALAGKVVRLLDPALGDGALALALIDRLAARARTRLHLVGYETEARAAGVATARLRAAHPDLTLDVRPRDFLADRSAERFDLVIANPPYVRTQILGEERARGLAARYGLEGRLDLYQAFTLELIGRLRPGGALGLITSNRFLTTKGAASFRVALERHLVIERLWDLGDTKVFDAAVLPAMIVARGRGPAPARRAGARFTSIYETEGGVGARVGSVVAALDGQGPVRVGSRVFSVQQGRLRPAAGDVWRLSSASADRWLRTVSARTWRRLGEVAKIRVGVKTTADRVFIRDDWSAAGESPELLRPLTTHHVAGRYRGGAPAKQILYPHRDNDGAREVVDLREFPCAARYLRRHRAALEARRYVSEAGRKWYELWVPHEPAAWARPKIVFRDIARQPTFWLDLSGSVVNGDCYWMIVDERVATDVLWLVLAVTNSSFIESFYDRAFNNKLYAGRRRFMCQYVERFPLPDPATSLARRLVGLAKARYGETRAPEQEALEAQIEGFVWKCFGFSPQGPAPFSR